MTQNAVRGCVVFNAIVVTYRAYLSAPLCHAGDIFSVARRTLHVCEADGMERLCPTAVAGETCRGRLMVPVVTGLAQSLGGAHCWRLVTRGAGEVSGPMFFVREITDSVIDHRFGCSAGSSVTLRTVHWPDLAMVTGVAILAACQGGLTVLIEGSVAIRAGQPTGPNMPLVREVTAIEANLLLCSIDVAAQAHVLAEPRAHVSAGTEYGRPPKSTACRTKSSAERSNSSANAML